MHKKSIALATFFALLGLVLPLFASAQIGLSLFPVKFIETVQPGAVFSGDIVVSNPNDQPVKVRVEVENLVTGDQGSIDLSTADVPYGLSAWISFNEPEFNLAPNGQRKVSFTIRPPENAEPAGYYGAILFRALDPGQDSPGIGISGRVGSVILIEVPGDTRKGATIDGFEGPGFTAQGPVDLKLSMSNTGNVHFEPEIAVHLSGIFFKNQTIELEPRVVFPGYSRDFTVTVPNKYLYGPIKASAEVNIPDIGVQFAEVTFWAFPWQNALIILVLIVAIIFTRREFKKRFKLVRVPKRKDSKKGR